MDVATIEKIKTEAMDRSQVMDIMSWLTDVYGPRLAWSPNLTKAGNWAATTMKGWGLSNVALEPWSTPAGSRLGESALHLRLDRAELLPGSSRRRAPGRRAPRERSPAVS